MVVCRGRDGPRARDLAARMSAPIAERLRKHLRCDEWRLTGDERPNSGKSL